MKLSEAFKDYRQFEIIAANKSPKTYETYKYAEKSFVDFFGDIRINKITPEMIANYYINFTRDYSSDTARGYIIALRAVLKRRKLAGENIRNIELIRIPQREKKTVRYLEKDDISKFIKAIGTPKKGYAKVNVARNVLLVELLFVSGARISEVLQLNRDSIKNKQFIAYGKSKMPRPCYINQRVEDLIKNYLELRDDNDNALFVSNQTKRRLTKSAAEFIFRRACNDAKMAGIHPHTMRHSFATYMLDNGVDIRNISDMLGHQNLNTTQIYTHVKNQRLAQEHARVMV